MSRRKQARPSRHLDDEDGQPLGPANEGGADGKAFACRGCRADLGSAEALAVHRTLCVASTSEDSAEEDFEDEAESNNNTQDRAQNRRRRKRDPSANDSPLAGDNAHRSKRRSVEPDGGESDGEEENEDELDEDEEERMEGSGKEMGLGPNFGSLPFLPPGVNSSTPASGGLPNAGMNPLFPYAATLANANMTLDAMQNTKMAIAQFAANHASSTANSQNPAALQELAVLQSTLYALQQQHLLQLQLIQQLQQQLQISHPEGVDIAEQLRLMGFPSNLAKTTHLIGPSDSSPTPSSHDSTPPPPGGIRSSFKETKESKEKDPRSKEKTAVSTKATLPVSDLKSPKVSKTEAPETDSAPNQPKPSEPAVKSSGLIQAATFLNTPVSNTNTSTSSSSLTSSLSSMLPGASLADSILQDNDPPPAPGGPSTLEMLQRTAQQVLNNASQGLLANNLADELGFRSNGTNGSSSDGKKDGLFKHRCRYCGKVFSSDSALQIHIRSHTGERPYKCNVCGNRFTTKGNLKVHFQRHSARFPHVKMNPNPVPEHLDKFHPPLLAQLDMDENQVSPPPPILAPPPPPVNPTMDPRLPQPGALFRANFGGNGGPNVPMPPFYRTPNRDLFPPRLPILLPPPPPLAGTNESGRDAQQENPENLSGKSTFSGSDKSAANLNTSQSSEEMNQPNKRIKVEKEDKDEDMDSDSDHLQKRDEPELDHEPNEVDRHDDTSMHSREGSPVDEARKAPLDDDLNNDDMSDREPDGDLPENLSSSKPMPASPARTAPSISPGGPIPLPPCSTASGMLPFMPHHFSPHLGPHMRFPLGFQLHGHMPPFGSGVQRESPAGNANGNMPITLHTPQGPFLLPADVDPAKDPAIYTNLLPRPGSNDNAWESLIEVTKTSETSKLQQLVDNIENKIVDPNQCVVCHRVLSCKSALQMHYRTHTGERPFKCKICGRAFTTKGNLKTHMGVHRAKPPTRMLHMCPVCHKKFTNGLILQQHIRLHTGEPTDLTPEQIQAAEVREFHPGFPAMLAGAGGFHPFLSHGHFNPMALRFPPQSLESYKPLNLCPNSDDEIMRGNSATPRADRDSKDDFEGSGGSSSEAMSPGSSINSCNLLLEQARALRYAAKAAASGGQDQDNSPDPVEDNRSLTGKSEPDNSSDYPPHIKQEPDYEELSHRMKDFDNNDCEDGAAKNYRSQCSSVDSKSPGLPSNGESRNSRPKSMLSPLDLTPRSGNVSAPSTTPPSLNSALSSLASSVYTTPSSFNPLNLPMSVPGRGNTTCNLCFKTFACHSALEIHYRSHTKERPFKCPVCDRGFSTKGNMKQHLMTHKHREGLNDDKNSRESTDSKNSSFSPSKTDFLSIHEALKFSQATKDRLTDEDSSPKQNGTRPSWLNSVLASTAENTSPSDRDRPLDCRSSPEENGDKDSTSNANDAKHLSSLTSLEHLANLAEHAMDGGHRTPIGLKVTADASWDDYHLRFDAKPERPGSHPKRSSSGLPKHLCHVCHKNFSSSSALQIHTRTHTGDKPFVCTLCAKAFTTRGNLKVHMGTHVLNHGHSRRGRRMSLDFPTLALIRNNSAGHPLRSHPQDPLHRLPSQPPMVLRSTIPLPEDTLPMRSAFTRPALRPELFFPYLLAQCPDNLLPSQRPSPESEECNRMSCSDSHPYEPPARDSPDSIPTASSPQDPRRREHRKTSSTEDWLWRLHCPPSPLLAKPSSAAPSSPAPPRRPVGSLSQRETCSPPPTTIVV